MLVADRLLVLDPAWPSDHALSNKSCPPTPVASTRVFFRPSSQNRAPLDAGGAPEVSGPIELLYQRVLGRKRSGRPGRSSCAAAKKTVWLFHAAPNKQMLSAV